VIHHGDLFDVLPTLAEASVDACVTDPPYGIGFMGREWDTFKPGREQARAVPNRQIASDNPNLRGRARSPAASPSAVEYDFTAAGLRGFQDWSARWAAEVYRVVKPGAYVVVCGAPRSHHRMMCGLEDAGFVVRDCFAWLFGSGFPKNHDLGEGKGTALKPAHEPIALAWKPFKGTIAATHSTYGTAALNIDSCRLSPDGNTTAAERYVGERSRDSYRTGTRGPDVPSDLGRWPANVLLDEVAAAQLDEMTGELVSGAGNKNTGNRDNGQTLRHGLGAGHGLGIGGDRGGASRFYYVAKPSRAERDLGCYDLAASTGGEATDRQDGSAGLNNPRAGAGRTGGARNIHPTVKPVELMRWLVRLVCPPGGTVLDPFTGSGTTGMACLLESREFIGIEREAQYVEIARRRITETAPLFAGEAAS
jgi:DNA modification methylase